MSQRQTFIARRRKDPDEELRYTFNWDDDYTKLAATGDAITDSAVAIYPFDGSIASDTAAEDATATATIFDDRTATVTVSGGTLWQKYAVTNTITTASGQTFVRSFRLDIIKR